MGHGLVQYNLLNVPDTCNGPNFSLPTDPRRAHFVALHAVTFAFCSAALLAGTMARCYGPHSAPLLKYRFRTQYVQLLVAGVLVIPAFIGLIMSAVLNSHRFLNRKDVMQALAAGDGDILTRS